MTEAPGLSRKDQGVTLSFNLAFVVWICTFFSYGIFSTQFLGGSVAQICWIAFCALLNALFWVLAQKYSSQWSYEWKLGMQDLIVFAGFCVVFALVLSKWLGFSLSGDELFHAQSTQNPRHIGKVIDGLTRHFSWLADFSYSSVVWFLNGVAAAVGLIFILLVRRSYFWVGLSCLTASFIFFRFVMPPFSQPHPPLRLLPLWLSSVFFGVHNLSYQLPQFVLLCLIGWTFFKIARRRLKVIESVLVSFACASIPVLMHSGTLVEFSIWTEFFALAVFYLVLQWEETHETKHLIAAVCAVGVGTLIRLPVIGLAVPLFAYLFFNRRLFTKNSGEFFLYCLPILIAVPFVLKSIGTGTPATYDPSKEFAMIPAHTSGLQRVFIALSSGTVWKIWLRQLGIEWVVFLVPAFLPFGFLSKRLSIFSFGCFLILFFEFYLISPSHWGYGRYQIEYMGLFLALGLLNVICFLSARQWTRGIGIALSCALIALNLHRFSDIGHVKENSSVQFESGYPTRLSKYTFDWDSALDESRELGQVDQTLLAGVVYGWFPQILSGASIREVRAAGSIYESVVTEGVFNLDAIEDNRDIELVWVGGREDILTGLKARGWKEQRQVDGKFQDGLLIGLVRGEK